MQLGPVKSGDAASLVFQPASWVERLRLTEMFPAPQPLEVELGSGDGSFLVQWAQAHPERNFIGVERLLGRLRKLDRRGLQAGLKNLRLMRIEASYFVEYLLPPGSVSALHLYFPDPWPKRRHRQHRLIQPPFVESVARALVHDGVVYLRTDDADYFAQMEEVFSANANFEAAPTPLELAAVTTDFERAFNARGVTTLRSAWRRTIRSHGP